MAALLTLADAKMHLRVTHAFEDAYLTQLCDAASDAVLGYLKRPTPEVDWTASTVPPRVKAALLLLLDDLYANRGADGTTTAPRPADGYLPPRVTALLHRDRDPALA